MVLGGRGSSAEAALARAGAGGRSGLRWRRWRCILSSAPWGRHRLLMIAEDSRRDRARVGAAQVRCRPTCPCRQRRRRTPTSAATGGCDIAGIRAAMADTERVRGGSTISQQVAKNVFLWPLAGGRWRRGSRPASPCSWSSCWPKRRIMEVYLNVAEMGEGAFGAEAAALAFSWKIRRPDSAAASARLGGWLPDPARPVRRCRGRATSPGAGRRSGRGGDDRARRLLHLKYLKIHDFLIIGQFVQIRSRWKAQATARMILPMWVELRGGGGRRRPPRGGRCGRARGRRGRRR